MLNYQRLIISAEPHYLEEEGAPIIRSESCRASLVHDGSIHTTVPLSLPGLRTIRYNVLAFQVLCLVLVASSLFNELNLGHQLHEAAGTVPYGITPKQASGINLGRVFL